MAPAAEVDMWTKQSGLVQYSRSRLLYYVSKLKEVDLTALSAQASKDEPLIADLQRRCAETTDRSSIWNLADLVDVAYRLRPIWKRLRIDTRETKAINMLGRLRAAYECFRSAAHTLDGVSTVEMVPVADLNSTVPISRNEFKESVKKLMEDLRLPQTPLKSKLAKKFLVMPGLHIHAEMQILARLETNTDWQVRAHRYIGASKKTCFLCHQMLQMYRRVTMSGTRHPKFDARQSHGKVYPLWTLPPLQIAPETVSMAFAAAIIDVVAKIKKRLQVVPITRPAVAESSAALTEAASLSPELEMLRQALLAEQRPPESWPTGHGDLDFVVLGRKVKAVMVGVLPADGSKPFLASATFHTWPKKRDKRIREVGNDLIPDFSSYWGYDQHDRRFRTCSLTEQAIPGLNGDYRLYWNENDILPENKTIQRFLALGHVETARRFWYGDILIVRYSEHEKTFHFDVHDTPLELLEVNAVWKNIFQDMWDSRYLEQKLDDEASFSGD